jgi:hypothetical protein
MRTPVLPRVADFTTQQALDAVAVTFDEIAAVSLLDGQLVGPIAIATTDTRVRHGLGQRAQGYFLVKAPADVRIFDGATPEATDPANFITLRASSAQTVTLWVF